MFTWTTREMWMRTARSRCACWIRPCPSCHTRRIESSSSSPLRTTGLTRVIRRFRWKPHTKTRSFFRTWHRPHQELTLMPRLPRSALPALPSLRWAAAPPSRHCQAAERACRPSRRRQHQDPAEGTRQQARISRAPAETWSTHQQVQATRQQPLTQTPTSTTRSSAPPTLQGVWHTRPAAPPWTTGAKCPREGGQVPLGVMRSTRRRARPGAQPTRRPLAVPPVPAPATVLS
mmetsp:Transcript_67177/g.120994  ORF Transcript_67177/g.120994 Transcript_67177/m.120994 type:complete len:232 (+) Transcript_67177:1032-1727(+)